METLTWRLIRHISEGLIRLEALIELDYLKLILDKHVPVAQLEATVSCSTVPLPSQWIHEARGGKVGISTQVHHHTCGATAS